MWSIVEQVIETVDNFCFAVWVFLPSWAKLVNTFSVLECFCQEGRLKRMQFFFKCRLAKKRWILIDICFCFCISCISNSSAHMLSLVCTCKRHMNSGLRLFHLFHCTRNLGAQAVYIFMPFLHSYFCMHFRCISACEPAVRFLYVFRSYSIHILCISSPS